MKKYWIVLKLGIDRLLVYRFNFLLGRLRNIIVLLLLFYVWRSLSLSTGFFAGYSEAELVTYVFAANLLRSIIFGGQTREIAEEINSGIFSKYLAMPVNYFWFNFSRELGVRFINFGAAIVEVIIFAIILRVYLVMPADPARFLIFTLAVILAVFLYFLLSFLISLLAFWSREAMGPRFLFEWILEFAAGAYFPLDILSPVYYTILGFLPFFYIIFLPISIYLGRLGPVEIMAGFGRLIGWSIVLACLSYLTWQQGLKRYTGEGI